MEYYTKNSIELGKWVKNHKNIEVADGFQRQDTLKQQRISNGNIK